MQYLAPDALARARRVRLVIFDVDGVLTDGRLWYTPQGDELKAFHAFDGHGVKLLLMAGLDTGIISGRDSPAGAQGAQGPGIQPLMEGVEDKHAGLYPMLKRAQGESAPTPHIGDHVGGFPLLQPRRVA